MGSPYFGAYRWLNSSSEGAISLPHFGFSALDGISFALNLALVVVHQVEFPSIRSVHRVGIQILGQFCAQPWCIAFEANADALLHSVVWFAYQILILSSDIYVNSWCGVSRDE